MYRGEPLEVVQAYEEAYNDHDFQAINSLYAPNARLQITGIMEVEGKQALMSRTDYDIELHTHIHVTPISLEGSKLRAYLTESNEWLREAGVKAAEYESEFEVADGRIKSIVSEPSPTTKDAITQLLKDFIPWAINERPREASILMPEGKIVFNAHNARLGLILLREWKSAH